MKAKPIQTDALASQIKSDFCGALIFGPEFGLVSELGDKIARMIVPDIKDDFCVIKLTPQKIKEIPTILLDEGNAVSLMGGRKLIWIRDADQSVFEAVQTYFDHIKTNTFLLMTAGNLTKSSALRAFCENHPSVLTIACYVEDEKDVAAFIRETLSEKQIQVSSAALPVLVERLSENRLTSKRELEKLITYLGNKKTVELSDVFDIITDTQNSSLDRFCFAVALGQQEVAQKEYHLMIGNGENPVGIIRILYNYFNKLFDVSDLVAAGSFDEALKKVLKPAQFRLKGAMQQQLKMWKKSHIFQVLNLLLEAERQCKSTGQPAELVLDRVILKVTSAAKRLK